MADQWYRWNNVPVPVSSSSGSASASASTSIPQWSAAPAPAPGPAPRPRPPRSFRPTATPIVRPPPSSARVRAEDSQPNEARPALPFQIRAAASARKQPVPRPPVKKVTEAPPSVVPTRPKAKTAPSQARKAAVTTPSISASTSRAKPIPNQSKPSSSNSAASFANAHGPVLSSCPSSVTAAIAAIKANKSANSASPSTSIPASNPSSTASVKSVPASVPLQASNSASSSSSSPTRPASSPTKEEKSTLAYWLSLSDQQILALDMYDYEHGLNSLGDQQDKRALRNKRKHAARLFPDQARLQIEVQEQTRKARKRKSAKNGDFTWLPEEEREQKEKEQAEVARSKAEKKQARVEEERRKYLLRQERREKQEQREADRMEQEREARYEREVAHMRVARGQAQQSAGLTIPEGTPPIRAPEEVHPPPDTTHKRKSTDGDAGSARSTPISPNAKRPRQEQRNDDSSIPVDPSQVTAVKPEPSGDVDLENVPAEPIAMEIDRPAREAQTTEVTTEVKVEPPAPISSTAAGPIPSHETPTADMPTSPPMISRGTIFTSTRRAAGPRSFFQVQSATEETSSSSSGYTQSWSVPLPRDNEHDHGDDEDNPQYSAFAMDKARPGEDDGDDSGTMSALHDVDIRRSEECEDEEKAIPTSLFSSHREMSIASSSGGEVAPGATTAAVGQTKEAHDADAPSKILSLSTDIERLSLQIPNVSWKWLSGIAVSSTPKTSAIFAVASRSAQSSLRSLRGQDEVTSHLLRESTSTSIEDVKRVSSHCVAVASTSSEQIGKGSAQVSLVFARREGGHSDDSEGDDDDEPLSKHTKSTSPAQIHPIHLDARPHLTGATAVCPFLPVADSLSFATGGADGAVFAWSYSSGKVKTTRLHALLHRNPITSLETLPKVDLIISGSRSNTGHRTTDLTAFDGRSTQIVTTWKSSDTLSHLSRTPHPRVLDMSLLRADYDQHKLFDLRQDTRPILSFGWDSSANPPTSLGRAAFWKSYALQGGPDGRIRLWDLRRPAEVLQEVKVGNGEESLGDVVLVDKVCGTGKDAVVLTRSAAWRVPFV